jgi:3-methylcrotonyl-CoA carboxylase alpha subunit
VVALAESEHAPLGGLAGFRLNAEPRRAAALGSGGTFASVSPDDGEVAELSGFTDGERVVVFHAGQCHEFALTARGSIGGHGTANGVIVAPMPGRVTAVEVTAGERVAKGQRLLTLEAMKMEHALTAPFDGTIAELPVIAGGQVQVDAVLARVEAEPSPQ